MALLDHRLFLVGLSLALVCGTSSTEGGSREDVLRLGYSRTLLVDVNPADAQVSTRLLAERIVERENRTTTVETTIFEDPEELRRALMADRLDMVSLLGYEFLELGDNVPIEPCFVPERGESVHDREILLVRTDRAEETLGDLEHAKVLIGVSHRNRMPLTWLDVVLLREGLPRSNVFFSAIVEVRNASHAVLPVFFGQADACVVTRASYETIVELNPQVSEVLTAIRMSPEMVIGVLCINSRSLNDRDAGLVRTSLASLHEDVRGAQMLSIFGIDRLTPFEPEYLESTRSLLAEHRLLTGGDN
jgi:ABC-type phosphate/phosphonate transport system substrate-binding protein